MMINVSQDLPVVPGHCFYLCLQLMRSKHLGLETSINDLLQKFAEDTELKARGVWMSQTQPLMREEDRKHSWHEQSERPSSESIYKNYYASFLCWNSNNPMYNVIWRDLSRTCKVRCLHCLPEGNWWVVHGTGCLIPCMGDLISYEALLADQARACWLAKVPLYQTLKITRGRSDPGAKFTAW